MLIGKVLQILMQRNQAAICQTVWPILLSISDKELPGLGRCGCPWGLLGPLAVFAKLNYS